MHVWTQKWGNYKFKTVVANLSQRSSFFFHVTSSLSHVRLNVSVTIFLFYSAVRLNFQLGIFEVVVAMRTSTQHYAHKMFCFFFYFTQRKVRLLLLTKTDWAISKMSDVDGWTVKSSQQREKADEKWNRSLRLLQSVILCSSPTPLMPASRQVNKQKWVRERKRQWEVRWNGMEDEWNFKMKRNWKHIIVVLPLLFS